jgi:hypothetical protein
VPVRQKTNKVASESESISAVGLRSAAAFAGEIKLAIGDQWLPGIYRERIMKLRTRSFHMNLPRRNATVEIQHTLLGIELKSRIICPDLSTARYLSVFAQIGCTDVAVPYDISRISVIADELESAWQRLMLLIRHVAGESTPRTQTRIRGILLTAIRSEIGETGAGMAFPEFNQNTKQRRP